ncbi:MAG: Gfo/Idh/MocA family oxidoreductase [Methylacidiphilales bacterium]|nr:Gfo/Idh/MocA family oxidoreductase [Candidatus Methylacidiphilales bacterium]
MTKLRWGIIGTGGIANTFADGLRRSQTGELVAVASRTRAKARDFAKKHDVPTAHGSYSELMADRNVDVVYIATPHPQHLEWVLAAAKAKKHILCEKPLALHHDEAVTMVQAAWENSVFFMEAYMYRCHPQIARMSELIRAGTIGDVRSIQASFGFFAPYDPQSRLFDPSLGGGGILDVGGYCTSMVRLIAGVAQGKPFAEAEKLSVFGQIGKESGVDEFATALIVFPGEIVATISCGLRLQQENKVRIEGSGGSLTLPQPWTGSTNGGETPLILERNGEAPETITITSPPIFAVEADIVGHHIAQGHREAAWPAMSWSDTLGNIRLQDEWRRTMDAPGPFTMARPAASLH